jgi:hypothetical protein
VASTGIVAAVQRGVATPALSTLSRAGMPWQTYANHEKRVLE